MNFKSFVHRRTFNEAIRSRKNINKEYLAILFLLTSHRAMWNRVKFFVQKEIIRFDDFSMSGCTEEEYTLFLCAKDIYLDARNITVSELADSNLIPKELFRIILTALEIARYGMDTSKLIKGVDNNDTHHRKMDGKLCRD